MTKKTKHIGDKRSGPGSSAWLSPRQPYTGDGKTKRSFIDGVIKVVFKKNTER
jgi:hypothetical protein